MISADTPPGTEVVTISAGPGKFGPSGLVEGAIYTVQRIVKGIDAPCVLLEEVAPIYAYRPPYGQVQIGYDLARFRYLDLPKSLTELLQEVELV